MTALVTGKLYEERINTDVATTIAPGMDGEYALMQGYTEEVGQTYGVQVEKSSIKPFLLTWLEEQKTVSPDGNIWE